MNRFAIGVVGGALVRQPRNLAEAVATAQALESGGWNFSLGIAQVNRFNLAKHKLDYVKAFEPCANLQAGSLILKDCYDRALKRWRNEQAALQAALSCYYSGNFKTGFKPDFRGQPSYVQKVLNRAAEVTGSNPSRVRMSVAYARDGGPATGTAQAPSKGAQAARDKLARDEGMLKFEATE